MKGILYKEVHKDPIKSAEFTQVAREDLDRKTAGRTSEQPTDASFQARKPSCENN